MGYRDLPNDGWGKRPIHWPGALIWLSIPVGTVLVWCAVIGWVLP